VSGATSQDQGGESEDLQAISNPGNFKWKVVLWMHLANCTVAVLHSSLPTGLALADSLARAIVQPFVFLELAEMKCIAMMLVVQPKHRWSNAQVRKALAHKC